MLPVGILTAYRVEKLPDIDGNRPCVENDQLTCNAISGSNTAYEETGGSLEETLQAILCKTALTGWNCRLRLVKSYEGNPATQLRTADLNIGQGISAAIAIDHHQGDEFPNGCRLGATVGIYIKALLATYNQIRRQTGHSEGNARYCIRALEDTVHARRSR